MQPIQGDKGVQKWQWIHPNGLLAVCILNDWNELMQGQCVRSTQVGSSNTPSPDVAVIAMQMLKVKDDQISKLYEEREILHQV